MLKKALILGIVLGFASLCFAKGTETATGTKTIEPILVFEYKFDEPIVDVIFDEATMTVKEARALGMKGLEGKKTTETVRVQHPKVLITEKTVKFYDKGGRVLCSKNLEDFGWKVWGNISSGGDKVFIQSFSEKKDGDTPLPINLFCLNNKGEVLWKKKFERYPCLSGNEKYIADLPSEDGGGVALYNIEGKKLWEKEGDFNKWVTAEILYDGKVVFAIGNMLYLIDQNGKELWNYRLEERGIGPGCIKTGYSPKKGNFFTVEGSNLYSFNDKGLLWKSDLFLYPNPWLLKDGDYLCEFGRVGTSTINYLSLVNKNGELLWKVDIGDNYNIQYVDITTKENGDIQILITGRKLENGILILDRKAQIIYSMKIPLLSQAKFDKKGENILLTTYDNRVMIYKIRK